MAILGGSADKIYEGAGAQLSGGVAVSPDGKLLASGGTDDAVTLWSTETGEQLSTLEGHTDSIAAPNGLDFSPDGRTLATAGYDGRVGLFDVESGEGELFEAANTGQVVAVEFDATGKQVISVNRDDLMIRIWDFDFRCTDPGDCWIAVPLTMGRLALYRLPYDHPPKSLTGP